MKAKDARHKTAASLDAQLAELFAAISCRAKDGFYSMQVEKPEITRSQLIYLENLSYKIKADYLYYYISWSN